MTIRFSRSRIGLICALATSAYVLMAASAHADASPTIRIMNALIDRGPLTFEVLMPSVPFLRRDPHPSEGADNGGNTIGTPPGENGADGLAGSQGGTITTSNESSSANVVNNGPADSNSSSGGNNGGASSGSGGDGGGGVQGGTVQSGDTNSNANVWNSINQTQTLITLRARGR